MQKKIKDFSENELNELGYTSYKTIDICNQKINVARNTIMAIETELKRREEKNGCELPKD